jgi:hypothetical protein
MLLTCVTNRSSSLSDHQRPRGETDRSVYPLTVGARYVVVGMGLWENILSVLVRDDWGGPCFAPAGLFELGVHRLPSGWLFGLFSGIRASGQQIWTDPRSAVWGYPELVNDPAHAGALEEGEAAALSVFAVRMEQAERVGDSVEG